MAKSIIKLDPGFDPKNRARLESRNYEKGFTAIPNAALPASYKTGLGAIFTALTGEDFDLEENTFAVSAENGIFKRLYAPAIFSSPATEDGTPAGLVIVWGDRRIPLYIQDANVFTEASKGNKNVKFNVREFGNYKDPSLTVSLTVGNEVYTFPFVVRPADVKNKLSVEEFEILVEESTDSAIAENVQAAPSGEGGSMFQGQFVKVSYLPLGTYKVTGYRRKDGGNYGPDFFLQTKIEEPFVAPIRVKEGEEWVEQEVEISDWAIVKPNSALKKILSADPEISEEQPATLHVLEHFTTNSGHPAAATSLQCSFPEDQEGVDLAF